MVGREDELGRLQFALDRARAANGGLVLISGEPGIGKTRLTEELAMTAGDRAVVVWGRVEEMDGAPAYWPWVQLLTALLDEFDRDVLSDALGSRASVIAAMLPEVKELARSFVPPVALGPGEARFRLHQAIAEFLECLSRRRCLVLILEDLHWADIATLELTRFIAARLRNFPILLVATYRSIDAGESEAFEDVLASLARHSVLERISLTGLTEAEVGRFIAQTIDIEPDAVAVSAVHARTEGNPFFVGELARLLQGDGLLRRGFLDGATRTAVPTGVRDVVHRRVARLPPDTRQLLALAAVIGRDFDLAILSAAGDIGELETLDRLEPAVLAGLVSEDATSVGRLRFSHALIRDTIYGELTASKKATLHGRVGAALEQRHGSDRTRLAELALHFSQAAPVVGPGPGLAYALQAADQAQGALAYEQAEDGVRRALELVEMVPTGPERWERELRIQNRLAALLVITRGQADPEVGRACTRARELSQRVGHTDELTATFAGLISFHFAHADFRIVVELAEQILIIGDQHSDTLTMALGHLARGLVRPYLDQLIEARASMAAEVALARTLEFSLKMTGAFFQHPLTIGLTYVARYAWLVGEDMEALAATEEAVQLARELGHPYSLGFALFMSAQLAVLMTDPALAEVRADEAIACCRLHGFGMLEAWSRLFHGWALAEQARPSEGIDEMSRALAVHHTTGARINTAQFLGLIADGERRRGDYVRALSLIDDALDLARMRGDRIYEADLHRRRGELLAAHWPDRREEAISSLGEAVSIAELQGAAAFKRRAEAVLASFEPRVTSTSRAVKVSKDSSGLSPRERELLTLVGRGLTDKEIASELVISLATVHSHLDRIRDKTGRRRRAELTRLAIEVGLTAE